MKQYREKMEKIQPSAGLEATVLAQVNAAGAANRRVCPRKFSAVLIAAVLCAALCIGVGASVVHSFRTTVYIPGRGEVEVTVEAEQPIETPQVWILDEIVQLGLYQIDYISLSRSDDAYALNLIVTAGEKELVSSGPRKSYFGQLTATLEDGRTFTLEAPKGSIFDDPEYTRFDNYICENFPGEPKFTLTTPDGETAEIALIPYDETVHVIERTIEGVGSYRLIPFAKGSIYFVLDADVDFLSEKWEGVNIGFGYSRLIAENGDNMYISKIVTHGKPDVFRFSPSAYEHIGMLASSRKVRYVDIRMGDSIGVSAQWRPTPTTAELRALPERLPTEGETLTLAQPYVLFADSDLCVGASTMQMKNGDLSMTIRMPDIVSPDGTECTYFNAHFYLRTADGTWYENKGLSPWEEETIDGVTCRTVTLAPCAEDQINDEVRAAFGEACGLLASRAFVSFSIDLPKS